MQAPLYREIPVPEAAAGMRLDRFLAKRFADLSRTSLARAIGDGLVRDPSDRPLRASARVRAGDLLRLYIPGIAPGTPPPPLPPILYEDDRLVALDKPPGLAAHPGGTAWAWAVIGLAKARWPEHRIDLVHRLDRDTSGVLVLTKDPEANAFLKGQLLRGHARKEYVALCKGRPAFEACSVTAGIARDGGEIRVKMAARADGLPARTDVEVLAVHPTAPIARVRCRIFTGRTHQIRVHLAHLGHPLLGDRLYGVPDEVFLGWQRDGATPENLAAAGAVRQALHAARLVVAHPDGGVLELEAPLPADLEAWWHDPGALPWDAVGRPPNG